MKIKSTKDIKADKLNLLLIGESGAGKTTLLSTLPGKTVIISAEAGLLSIRNKEIDYIEFEAKDEVEKLHELRKILDFLVESDYDNIAIDSLTEISNYFSAFCESKWPEEKHLLKRYGTLKELLEKFIREVRDMNKNIIFTSLIKTKELDNGTLRILPDIPGSFAQKINGYFDFVLAITKVKVEDEEKRVILTESQNGFICKDRSGNLNKYERPDLTEIIEKAFKE